MLEIATEMSAVWECSLWIFYCIKTQDMKGLKRQLKNFFFNIVFYSIKNLIKKNGIYISSNNDNNDLTRMAEDKYVLIHHA